ncbi:hypothetical protein RsTz2092_06740 [Deferribacterales bacterium RsTz2092]
MSENAITTTIFTPPPPPPPHNQYLSRFKPLLFLLISIIAIICTYCVLSILYVGYVGVPLKFQKYIEISGSQLYSGIGSEFSIAGVDKDIIRSNIDNATITFSLGDKASKDWRRISLVAEKINPSNGDGGAYVQYINKAGQSVQRSFEPLRDGINPTKKLRDTSISKFNLCFAYKTGFSVKLDSAILSKYPVLPNTFIVPAIVLSIAVLIIVWLCFYKGLYRWFIGHNWALLAVIVLAQFTVFYYYVGEKKDLLFDEVTDYYEANGGDRIPFIYDEVAGIEWHSSQGLFQDITAQQDEGLSHFNKLRTRRAIHSPIHSIQLHLVSLLSPNQFSMWIGYGVNIVWFIALSAILYALSKRILPNKLALLPPVLYGFGWSAIAMMVYIRSYVTATFFYTLLAYLALDILEKSKLTKRFYLTLAITAFFGVDAHNYFAFWFIGFSIIPIAYLLHGRRFVEVAKCAVSLVLSGVFYYVFNPSVLGALNDGSKVVNNVSGMVALFIEWLQALNGRLFNGTLLWLALLIVVLLIVAMVKSRILVVWSSKSLLCASIALAIFLYLLTISRWTNVVPMHSKFFHIWDFVPSLVLLLVVSLKYALDRLLGNVNIAQKLLVALVLVFALINNRSNSSYYYSKTNYNNIATSYRDIPAILISNVPYGVGELEYKMLNLRETTVILENMDMLGKALSHLPNDKQVIIYARYSGFDEEDIGKDIDREAIFSYMKQHGWTERVPYIDKTSWLFSK